MKQYICPQATGCKHECAHKVPHSFTDLKGCGNVRCHKKIGAELTGEDYKRVGKGLKPECSESHECVEVK